MKIWLDALLGSGLLALAACGGQGDDALGDNVADAAEVEADMLEEQADNAVSEGQEERLEDQADVVREAGEEKEEAIDDADVIVNNKSLAPQIGRPSWGIAASFRGLRHDRVSPRRRMPLSTGRRPWRRLRPMARNQAPT